MKKKIIFLSGTRADFGKLKSLINITIASNLFDVHIFVTGMHLDKKFGYTIDEIRKSRYPNIFAFQNHKKNSTMDAALSKTIEGFSNYIRDIKPDLIVVHGDRVEALAGAISGSLNNILVAHIEGGEISGTIDELIRHAVTKMSHIHFVANSEASFRLLQLGELESSIHIIGSPDLDLMNPKNLIDINIVKSYYDIYFNNFSIAMFHPVTTEIYRLKKDIDIFVKALINSKKNYVVIFPNNDLGSDIIINEYKKLKNKNNFRVFPSLRFEYFLSLLFYSDFIIGNSSAGIREAPFYKKPSINIGTRQNNRSNDKNIIHCNNNLSEIEKAINSINYKKKSKNSNFQFGTGDSDKKFIKIIKNESFWKTNKQKQFQDV